MISFGCVYFMWTHLAAFHIAEIKAKTACKPALSVFYVHFVTQGPGVGYKEAR